MMKPTCDTCRFYDGSPGAKLAPCRRNAPRSHLVSADGDPEDTRVRGVWPIVSAEDWCGQFERRKGDA
jgi:hypothetical protein